jgi:6-phosphogluconolactonase (cycloisomerase 2 family)
MTSINPYSYGSQYGPVTSTTTNWTTSIGGSTYTLHVFAYCYNSTTGIKSLNSAEGTSPYYRPPRTIATGSHPVDIAISANGTSVYVANAGGGSISMYSRNTTTGLLTALSPATIITGGLSEVRGITISADGKSVYATNVDTQNISMFSRNTTTGLLTALTSPATISAGSAPYSITISADGKSAYASDCDYGNVLMYSRNTTTGRLTALSPATIGMSHWYCKITISADDKSVYVYGALGHEIVMYSRNTITGLLTAMSPASITTGTAAPWPYDMVLPVGVKISADGKSAYASNAGATSPTVAMYSRNTTTGLLTALSPASIAMGVGSTAGGLTISADGASVYATNNQDKIYMYSRNTTTGLLTALSPATVPTSVNPEGITISADGKSVYVINSDVDTISMYGRDTTTGLLWSY